MWQFPETSWRRPTWRECRSRGLFHCLACPPSRPSLLPFLDYPPPFSFPFSLCTLGRGKHTQTPFHGWPLLAPRCSESSRFSFSLPDVAFRPWTKVGKGGRGSKQKKYTLLAGDADRTVGNACKWWKLCMTTWKMAESGRSGEKMWIYWKLVLKVNQGGNQRQYREKLFITWSIYYMGHEKCEV